MPSSTCRRQAGGSPWSRRATSARFHEFFSFRGLRLTRHIFSIRPTAFKIQLRLIGGISPYSPMSSIFSESSGFCRLTLFHATRRYWRIPSPSSSISLADHSKNSSAPPFTYKKPSSSSLRRSSGEVETGRYLLVPCPTTRIGASYLADGF